MLLPDPPDLARILATGYPEKSNAPRCDMCNEVLTGDVYIVGDRRHCPKCYRDYLEMRIKFDDLWDLAGRFEHLVCDVSDLK